MGNYAGAATVTGGNYGSPEVLSVNLGVWAPFVITAITPSGNDIALTWTATGGTTNVVQAVNGNLTGGFMDISSNLIISGSGMVTNSYTDSGGATNSPSRFYRIRLGP